MAPPPTKRTVPPLLHAAQMFDDAVSVGPPVFLAGASGGKDSAVCIQLMAEARKRHPQTKLAGLYWYRVPDIECMERPIRQLCDRFEMPLYRVPHDLLTSALLAGTNREFTVETNNVPALKVVDLELAGRVRFAAHLSGIPERDLFDEKGKLRVTLKDFKVNPFHIWMVYGHRQNESLERRAMLNGFRNQLDALGLKSGGRLGFDRQNRRIYPLATWNRQNVMAMVRHHRLPLAPTFGKSNTTGLDPFSSETLLWLKTNAPSDYAKVVRLFPRCAGLV